MRRSAASGPKKIKRLHFSSTRVCESVAILSLCVPEEMPRRGGFQRSQDSAVRNPA
jgi:hypothetical protein